MNESLAYLADFVNESTATATESAETTTEAPAVPAPDAGNLKPVDAANVAGSVKPKADKIDFKKIKMPGGIAALLILVLLLVFAIVPTKSGKTRLQLIWSVLYKGGKLRGQSSLKPHGSHGSNDSVENNNFYAPVPNSPGMFYGPGGVVVDRNGDPVTA